MLGNKKAPVQGQAGFNQNFQGQPMQNPAPKQQKPQKQMSVSEQINKRARTTTLAVIIALIAVVLGIGALVVANIQVKSATANASPTVVLKTDVRAGTVLTADMLTIANVPASLRASNAIGEENAAAVVGHSVLTDLAANTQITPTLLAGGNASSLAAVLESGKEAVTISVGTETGLACLVHVGDYVNVVLPTMSGSGAGNTRTVASQVKVVAEDMSLYTTGEAYSSVTLEVSHEQANSIREAQMEGTLYLSLISAADLSTSSSDSF